MILCLSSSVLLDKYGDFWRCTRIIGPSSITNGANLEELIDVLELTS